MNAIVQTLNTAGRAFVGAAVPMLIQSSLLILILLAVDTVLRKRVRAVFRYWIWMLVLVKLVLPPSLWSPVSVGTWVGDTLEVPAAALLERGGYVSRASSPRFEGGTPSTQQGPGSPNAISSRLGTHDALATRLSPAVADFLSQPQPMTVVPSPAEPCGPAALGWGSITPEGGGATRSVAHPPALLVNTKGQGARHHRESDDPLAVGGQREGGASGRPFGEGHECRDSQLPLRAAGRLPALADGGLHRQAVQKHGGQLPVQRVRLRRLLWSGHRRRRAGLPHNGLRPPRCDRLRWKHAHRPAEHHHRLEIPRGTLHGRHPPPSKTTCWSRTPIAASISAIRPARGPSPTT